MIRLFRKIRHKLLSEQSYGIYILYASGEMLLVVVGILFALQIDTWNSIKKDRNEELGILNHLLVDLQEAKRQSSAFILSETDSRSHLLQALNAGSETDILWTGQNSDSIFYDIIWTIETEVPVLNSYLDLNGSGEGGLITNLEIRRHFSNLELSFSSLQSVVDDRLYIQQLRIDDIAVDDINYVRFAGLKEAELMVENEAENDYFKLLSNPRIRNLLAIKLNVTNTIIRYQQELDHEIVELIALIQEEIGILKRLAE
jgi:hypothetical protein